MLPWRAWVVRAAGVAGLLVLAVAVQHDVRHGQQRAGLLALEQLYLHTYPARKLYRRYVQPYLDIQGHFPANRLQLLDVRAGLLYETRAATHAVAVVDMRAGPVELAFPATPLFQDALFSVVGWDGLAVQGGAAHGARLLLEGNGFDSVLLFLRLPLDRDAANPLALEASLAGVRIGTVPARDWDFSAVRCEARDPHNDLLACIDSLLAVTGRAPAFAAELAGYRERLGALVQDNPVAVKMVLRDADASLEMALRHNLGYMNAQRWTRYRDFFVLGKGVTDPLLTRAAFFAAPFLAIPDPKAKTAVLFNDEQGRLFHGSEGDFDLLLQPALMSATTVDWSVSVYPYDSAQLFAASDDAGAGATPALVQRSDAPQQQADGSIRLYLSQQRPADVPETNWLPVPPGPFTVVYRAHLRELAPDPFDEFVALSTLRRLPATAP